MALYLRGYEANLISTIVDIMPYCSNISLL